MTTPQPRQREAPEDRHVQTREWQQLLASLEGEPLPCAPGGQALDADWTSDRPADQARAARWCQGCRLLNECRSYALATKQSHGVWGGTTPAQRKAELRRQRRAAA